MHREYEKEIQELLGKMTLEEKVGQLNHLCPTTYGAFAFSEEELIQQMREGKITFQELESMRLPQQDCREEDIRAGRVGVYAAVGRKEARRLQKIAVEESRLGIPLLFGRDVIHGYRTITPIPLGESCAFDEALWEQTARMSAREAAYDGVGLTYAPMVDVSKDARWGRIAESAGEDTLMNARYGAAKVRGYQTSDPSRPDTIAACVKHFCGYGFVEGGRDYNRVEMSEQRLWEDVLPPFQACVEAGALGVMPSFNDINGVPSSVNGWLLRDVLRKEWGFAGTTISDANAVAECITHGVCADAEDAARQALTAGMDVDMSSGCYPNHLKELVEAGQVSENLLNEAVANVLRVKFSLGLFENPYGILEEDPQPFLKPAYRQLARQSARESMVLLKNTGVLPLKPETKLAVLGELAADAGEMTGTWALDGKGEDCVGVLEGLKARGARCTYYASVAQIQQADVLLLVLGEKKCDSGEATSKTDLRLPPEQRALIRAAAMMGKPVVAILLNGRPLVLGELLGCADAILEAWHPGVEGGNAIADVLYGAYNPSGKLTTTFPNASGQCPCYYDYTPTGRPASSFQCTSRYLDVPMEPAFPFGWGLSYTTFSYEGLKVEKQENRIVLGVTVKNTGNRAGVEVVQCYFRDPVARRTRPVKRLLDFRRVPLSPGQQEQVCFQIPVEQLGYYDERARFVIEPGEFVFMVGGNSRDVLTTSIVL